jgi:ASC-1-like (ASCH) protein
MIQRPSAFGLHLAIFVEPYLRYILEGKKTVESRFSERRVAPYESVRRDDVILLKKSGGPIVGLCQATDIWYYELDPQSWRNIRTGFSKMLCAQDPDFWNQRKSAEFATLIRLTNVLKINPFKYVKSDRRGWVVLKPVGE